MNTGVKVLIGAGVLAGLAYLIKKGSTYQAIADKFKFYFGTPRIHNVSLSKVDISVDNIRIVNQSPVDLIVNNIYTSVQYLDPTTNTYKDLLIQDNPLTNVVIKPYQSNNVNSMMLSMPVSLTTLGILKKMIVGKVNNTVRVITRMQVGGVEVPAIEESMNIKSLVNGILDRIPGANLLATQVTDTNTQRESAVSGLANLLSTLI